jgi:hypothetical protein
MPAFGQQRQRVSVRQMLSPCDEEFDLTGIPESLPFSKNMFRQRSFSSASLCWIPQYLATFVVVFAKIKKVN